jgi:hypothetical protein
MNGDILFYQKAWHQFVTDNREALEKELNDIDGNRLLNTSEEDLIKYFIDKYYFDVPEINEDEIVIETNEVNIDVSKDPLRSIYDRSKPFYIKGTQMHFLVQLNGQYEGNAAGETIEECTKKHINFKKERGIVDETIFKYVFANKEDANRELLITVMVFDIPTGQTKT